MFGRVLNTPRQWATASQRSIRESALQNANLSCILSFFLWNMTFSIGNSTKQMQASSGAIMHVLKDKRSHSQVFLIQTPLKIANNWWCSILVRLQSEGWQCYKFVFHRAQKTLSQQYPTFPEGQYTKGSYRNYISW